MRFLWLRSVYPGDPDSSPPRICRQAPEFKGSLMIIRGILGWLLILAAAIANGTLRVALLNSSLGEPAAHVVSTALLCCLVLVITWLLIRWIHPASPAQAAEIGLLWLALTLAFEFGAGHFLFGNPWEKLLADYNVLQGRVWVAVLVVTLLAPFWTGRLRGLFASATH